MKILWEERAWDDYLFWQETDKKTLRKINALVKDMIRDPFSGLGKPEPLRGDFSGLWSRRINHADRIVYFEQDGTVYIIACRGHYDD